MTEANENDGYLPFPKGFATTAIHAFQEPERWDSMAVVAPLVTSTTFQRYDSKNFKTYEYARYQNPTREVLENVLAALDAAKYGLTFSSGLGAISSLFYLLKTGENLIVGSDIYGGTQYVVNKAGETFNIDVTVVDLTDIKQLEKAIKPNTKMILAETPTNPSLKVLDMKAIASVAKKYGIIFVLDNTFLTPYLQRPLDFGADIVLYSLTKYMNGHSDVCMGAITTSNKELYDRLKNIQMFVGAVPSPFDCYQVIRSLKTLPLRMRQHNKNALAVAQFLEKHPRIEKVLHPGLKSHPQHELFKKQTCGHSGIFAFYLKGSPEETNQLAKNLKCFILAHSLGGVDSLTMIPYHGSHEYVEHDIKIKMGITENLIRLSVGLEDVEDLIKDLDEGLRKLDEE